MTRNKGSTSADADALALHKQWDKITCPICMDHPHNAVLLLCSSHDKGCRPYICNTSYRHSNCLDRFGITKSSHLSSQTTFSFLQTSESARQEQDASRSGSVLLGSRIETNTLGNHEDINIGGESHVTMAAPNENITGNPNRTPDTRGEGITNTDGVGGRNVSESNETLKCPLCRGKVLGWKVVEEARLYLDQKRRSCSRELCSFSGNYKDLRRHARKIHPSTRPSDVDMSRQRAWHHLENQREHADVLSAIRSAIPNAIIVGDYVIENGARFPHNRDAPGTSDDFGQGWAALLHMMSSPPRPFNESGHFSRAWRTQQRSSRHRDLRRAHPLGVRNANGDRSTDNVGVRASRRWRRLPRPRRDRETP